MCLSVAQPPDIPNVMVVPYILNEDVGNAAAFRCIAVSGQPDRYEWRWNGGAVPSNAIVEGNELRFARLLGEEGGKYSCVAFIPDGQVTAFATLIVQKPTGRRIRYF